MTASCANFLRGVLFQGEINLLVFLLFSVWIFRIQSLHEVQGRNCVLMRFSSVQSDLFGS